MTALQTGDYVLTSPRSDGGWWLGRHLVAECRDGELQMYRVASPTGTVKGDGWVTIEHVSGGPQFEVRPDVLIPVSVLTVGDSRYEGNVPVEDDGLPKVTLAQCGHCQFVWNDALSTSLTPPPAGRCPNEDNHVHDNAHDEARTTASGPYVTVVYISHSHGHDITLHATDASAVSYLADYCRFWWTDCPAAQRMEMPEDEQARIDAYFDENESEFVEMETAPIQGAGPIGPVRLHLSRHDDTTTAEIQAVIDGDTEPFDLTGLDEHGREVTITLVVTDTGGRAPCRECGHEMWIDDNETSHHWGNTPDSINHDLDGDHVAVPE